MFIFRVSLMTSQTIEVTFIHEGLKWWGCFPHPNIVGVWAHLYYLSQDTTHLLHLGSIFRCLFTYCLWLELTFLGCFWGLGLLGPFLVLDFSLLQVVFLLKLAISVLLFVVCAFPWGHFFWIGLILVIEVSLLVLRGFWMFASFIYFAGSLLVAT